MSEHLEQLKRSAAFAAKHYAAAHPFRAALDRFGIPDKTLQRLRRLQATADRYTPAGAPIQNQAGE